MTAIPEFAPYAVPLALEKLTSDLQVAKTDSIILLVIILINNLTNELYFASDSILTLFSQKECFNKFVNDEMYSQIASIMPVLLQELRLEVAKDGLAELIADLIVLIIKYIAKFKSNEDISKILCDIYASKWRIFQYSIRSNCIPRRCIYIFRCASLFERYPPRFIPENYQILDNNFVGY